MPEMPLGLSEALGNGAGTLEMHIILMALLCLQDDP